MYRNRELLENTSRDLGDYLRLTFYTVWAAAEGIYKALLSIIYEHNLGITVTWFYDEPGMHFAGYLGAAR